MTLEHYDTDDEYCDVESKRANLSFTDWFAEEYSVDQHTEAELDTNQLQYTGSENSVSRTTFYANGKDGYDNDLPKETQEKFEHLWLYQCGFDGQTHAGESVDSKFKVDTRARDNRQRAEAVCMQVGVSEQIREKVSTFVATEEMRRYSGHYRGVDGAIIAELAYQVADSIDDALQHPVIQSETIQSLASSGFKVDDEGNLVESTPIDVDAVVTYQFDKFHE